MSVDTGWAVSLSVAGIVATIGILFLIDLAATRSELKSKKLMNFA